MKLLEKRFTVLALLIITLCELFVTGGFDTSITIWFLYGCYKLLLA